MQTNRYEGVLAGKVVDAVVENLIAMKQLPDNFRTVGAADMGRVMLSPPSRLKVVGRKAEVQRVVNALTEGAGAALLVGGPGVGKSTVAIEAGLKLCRQGWFPGGAFALDLSGVYPKSPCLQ
jgi:Mrp family chromosome partitioning ATPase